jgi:hypothetical protein
LADDYAAFLEIRGAHLHAHINALTGLADVTTVDAESFDDSDD